MSNQEDRLKTLIGHAKEYGFVFPSSEIYDGLSATYDYGPYGVELKNNIRRYWWESMTKLNENIVGIDAAIFMHPTVWKASGHVDAFNDPLIDNKDSKKRYRADVLLEEHIGKYEQKIAKEIEKARGGVWLSEGPTQGMQVKVERAGNERSSIKVVLHEGKNREIRRVFAKLDLPVLELKRIRIGELNLHGLKPGDWRFLLAHEIKELLDLSAAAAGEAAPAADVADAATRSAWNSGKSTGKKAAPKKPAPKKPEPEDGGDDSDVDDGDEW